jgi:hypothetical protein
MEKSLKYQITIRRKPCVLAVALMIRHRTRVVQRHPQGDW